MVYQTGNMLLQEKQKLYQGKVNDVIVCQDLAADVQTYYTVLIIKDHQVTKQILKLYKDGGIQSRNTCAKCLKDGELPLGRSWPDHFKWICVAVVCISHPAVCLPTIDEKTPGVIAECSHSGFCLPAAGSAL